MSRTGGSPEKPRVLVVVGTRPEAIKMAPVVEALERREDILESALALTGQHTEMVDQVLDAFGMVPAYDLGVMREGQNLYDLAHACLDGLQRVVTEYRPHVVLVQGDTATVFYAGLVAFLEGVRVGHVEAGLRSGKKWSPFPEEIFRRLTDVLTDFYFAPTPGARKHLLEEGVPAERILLTGNTVVDALKTAAEKPHTPQDPVLATLLNRGRPLILLTAHRRESFGEPLRQVFGAVRGLAEELPEADFLYPVHPNPNVLHPAREILSDHPRIHLTDPLGYLDLVQALKAAALVMTDSGGIQEEAPTFGAPVLVLREVTERPEGVEAGVAHLVGTDPDVIREGALRFLAQRRNGPTISRPRNPYGDGKAGERIADALAADLTGISRTLPDWSGP